MEITKELVEFLAQAKGPILAHISDTQTSAYPFVRELLAFVKPALTIHTGDMADELKAGRIPEHVAPYLEKTPELMKTLKELGGEVWIVPGNNDVMEYLNAEEGIDVLEPGAIRVWNGLKMQLSHHPIEKAQDVDFAIYGHVYSYDMHRPWQNPKEGVNYINGVFEWSFIDGATGQYVQIQITERKK